MNRTIIIIIKLTPHLLAAHKGEKRKGEGRERETGKRERERWIKKGGVRSEKDTGGRVEKIREGREGG